VSERRFVSWASPDGTIGIQVTGIDPVRGTCQILCVRGVA
jgi:hypothetical protein